MAKYRRNNRIASTLMLVATGTILLTLSCGLGGVMLTGCAQPQEVTVDLRATPVSDTVAIPQATPSPPPTPTPTPSPTPTPRPDTVITIRVVGDIMCHDRQLAGAKQEDGSYDMDPWFDEIRESIQCADLAIGNLETTFMGSAKDYQGFPKFNTPDAYADALKNAGFDVLTMANNHANDFRIEGITRTMQVLDERGLRYTGCATSEEEYEKLLTVQVQDIQIGILAYTDTFNSEPKKDYHVRKLDEEQVRKDVKTLRDMGAEYILCMVHWGDEYEEQQDRSQERNAQMLAENGVDAILGSHPHVVQTAEMLHVTMPDGSAKTVPVAYSMGNFISNQQDRPRDMGVIFELTLRKSAATGAVTLDQSAYIPTLVYRYDNDRHTDDYRILPCGIYRSHADHPKQRRSRKVWEHQTELMGEGWVAKER